MRALMVMAVLFHKPLPDLLLESIIGKSLDDVKNSAGRTF